MTASAWKTTLLPRLEGFALAPYGGGEDGKHPIAGNNWQKKLETVEQITARNGTCPCVAVYPGRASAIECFDIDGKTAHDKLASYGINVDEAVENGAWKIYRDSTPYRYKLIFKVEAPERLEEFKGSIVTLVADKPNKVKQEAIEYFFGKQGAIVAGLHKLSGDFYSWENGPNGNGIEDLTITPLEWRKLRATIRATKKTTTGKEEWLDADQVFGSCPSCGREGGEGCRAKPSGKELMCYFGSTYYPDPSVHSINGLNGDVLLLRGEKHHWGRCLHYSVATEQDENALADAEIRHEQVADFRSRLGSEIDLFDVFHPTLAMLLTTRASSLPCDPTAYVMPMLATAASVIGKRVKFRVKTGHEEACVIWGGNVMPPSSLKSPISADLIRPVERIEWEGFERCKPKPGQDDKEVELPRRYVVESATHAALLGIACQEKTMGLVIYHDELASLFAEMEKSHNTAMRAELLKLWTGGKISYDTKTSGHLHTPNTAISLFGNIQPDKLKSLISADGKINSSGDGLWCRFLWCRPKEVQWEFNEIEADITSELGGIFRSLDLITAQTIALSEEAKRLVAPVWNGWEAERATLDPAEAAFMGKLRGYSVRVAGVLHLIDLAVEQVDTFGSLDTGSRTIPAEAMARAIRLCNFCRVQWQQLQAELGHGAVPAEVANFLAKVDRAGWESVTPREIIRGKILGRDAKTEDAARFLRQLAERWGAGSITTGRGGGLKWVPTR